MPVHETHTASKIVGSRLYPFETRAAELAGHLQDPDDQLKQITKTIDDEGPPFNWRVFLVAASGFLTDSYNLFASNVILPCLAFVYWEKHSQPKELTVNAVTLAGSAVGCLLFGPFADRFGRQSLYGIELLIVVFSTIGMAQSAYGYRTDSGETSMSITSWLMTWRFVMGIGVGAEYPLSAAISAEWAPRYTRGRMMATIFLMQPLGQLFAYGVGFSVLEGLTRHYDFTKANGKAKLGIDILLRAVIGVGSVPAVVAILFRFLLPETARYTYGVKKKARRARADTHRGLRSIRDDLFVAARQWAPWRRSPPTDAIVEFAMSDVEPRVQAEEGTFQSPASQRHQETPRDPSEDCENPQRAGQTHHALDDSQTRTHTSPTLTVLSCIDPDGYSLPDSAAGGQHISGMTPRSQFNLDELSAFFVQGGNWRRLAGMSICWFLLDFAFFGLGFNNPGTMAKIWSTKDIPQDVIDTTSSWLLNSSAAAAGNHHDIYHVLRSNMRESLVTVCAGSILGCAAIIYAIEKLDRRKLLTRSFLALSAGLLVTGLSFKSLFHHGTLSYILPVFYGLIQFGFSFGPNTLTFVMAAEIFPTKYRCTCYGIAAAGGKLGSVMVQVAFLTFDQRKLQDPNSPALGYMIILFAGFMLFGAIFAWAWIPAVQVRNTGGSLEGMKLEDLAKGRENLEWFDQPGFRTRLRVFWKKRIEGSSQLVQADEVAEAQSEP
ncbi:phosphate transporter protein [Teratosphaeria destructans]|uniref:Phosphate transporter protein n=1 Tax=Teratosphaeria destructans TaxID=418781 RepID=A0A9W7W2F5_9PEZI|nr:phosphate transporter protein [Teratosphaeria destructans]